MKLFGREMTSRDGGFSAFKRLPQGGFAHVIISQRDSGSWFAVGGLYVGALAFRLPLGTYKSPRHARRAVLRAFRKMRRALRAA
jgi:hypothetical protein